MVEQLAPLDAAALLALARHVRTRLVPGGDIPTPAVAERIVRMSAAELRALGQRLRYDKLTLAFATRESKVVSWFVLQQGEETGPLLWTSMFPCETGGSQWL